MKFVGIIPARYESSRFPGKPLIDLKGKSMIQRVYEGANKSEMLDEVIVATDDHRIVDEVKKFGGKVVMTSTKHSTGSDRCGEIAKTIDADVIINIQGDEPLIDSKQLDQLCAAFSDRKVSIATLGIKRSDEDANNPNRIKMVLNSNKDAMYFSRSAIPNTNNATLSGINDFNFFRHIGVYGYKKETLLKLIDLEKTKLEQVESLEQLRWLYHGYSIRVVETNIETPNIDVPEDVEKVLLLL
ncbi:3-deoxy-manno-octulosonate cytidylyltransferase [Crocinitomicaceae bacterium]|nr:3-deoxy-manno-octulosonate cytidylyltransferase [Crocinitomicaceae bacterium]